MKKQVSLFWARLQLQVVKLLPMIIALLYVLNTILSYFDFNAMFLNFLGGMSFLPLVFLYISSFAFRFCEYHRMFLHYIATTGTINWVDYVFILPISDLHLLMLLMVLFGITCFIALFMFLKIKGRLQN